MHERQTRAETECTVPQDTNNKTRECLLMTNRFNPQSNKVYSNIDKSKVDPGSQSRIRKVQDWTKNVAHVRTKGKGLSLMAYVG